MVNQLAMQQGFSRLSISEEVSRTTVSSLLSSSWLTSSLSSPLARSFQLLRRIALSAPQLRRTHRTHHTGRRHCQIACMPEPTLVHHRSKKKPIPRTCLSSFYSRLVLRTLLPLRFSWNCPASHWHRCWCGAYWGCSSRTRSFWVGLVESEVGSGSNSCLEGWLTSFSSCSCT